MAMEEIGFFKNLFISGLDRVEIIVIKTQTKRIIFLLCSKISSSNSNFAQKERKGLIYFF